MPFFVSIIVITRGGATLGTIFDIRKRYIIFIIFLPQMSDYVIHNIGLTVSPQLDFNHLVEATRPVAECPNYYLGKKTIIIHVAELFSVPL